MRLTQIILFFAAGIILPAVTAYASDPVGTARSNEFKGALNVESVVRKSGVVTIRGLVKNDDKGTEGVKTCEHSYLLDPEKGIKYEVLEDEKGTPVGSSGVYIPNGSERPIWCKYPAPPAEVKTVGYVYAGFESVDDLPITDK